MDKQKKLKTKTSIKCISCEDSLEDNHEGIKCEQNHAICVECCDKYIGLIFAEPFYNIPPKCPECKKPVVIETIEKQLDFTKLIRFHRLLGGLENDDDSHDEYVSFENENFVSDDNDHIGNIHIKIFDNEKSRNKQIAFENDKDYKLFCKIGKAIEDGSKVYCPKCKIGGRKDDACTNITCGNCRAKFCYVCGLSQFRCNKKFPRIDIMYHNCDWKKNKLRCPNKLSYIRQVDSKWSDIEHEQRALDFFHRLRILKKLKKLIKKEGLEKVSEFEKKYGIFGKAGVTIDEILNTDDQIINRNMVTYKPSVSCTVI